MKHSRLLLLSALATAMALPVNGQVKVDYKKYPDYTSRIKADDRLRAPEQPTERPAYVNNADTPYWPGIINQAGGSCGSASRIAYMFNYEINCLRGVNGALPENQYPTHFTWLLTNSNSGKDGMAIANGVPNVTVYGGRTYSDLFGYQDCADPDFGWMQGYDKWYSAMFNRLERTANFPVSVQSEEGREAVKHWLWNHSGNPDYPGGGICGIGVASGGDWKNIPKTTTNDEIGVAGKWYVGAWGTQVDHALTIVGYDDRIEFDLDGNGVAGEKEKDEVGAWIVANSWGDNWCNNGFIYCPYKNATPTASGTGYYQPEIYYIRRNYRPLRTMKILMDYSKRSELKLTAGISADLSAEEPEQTIEFEHFKFAGDGDNNGVDASTPMLGRWIDGIHSEAMEFGYDLTDLSSAFDTRRPLKYFFIIESKSSADGTGTIQECAIMDYEFDKEGIEIPFNVGDGVAIQNKGKKTIISVTVAGEPINAPRNLTASAGTLHWDAPAASPYTLVGYNIYCDSKKTDRVEANVQEYTMTTAGSYQVAAVYKHGEEEIVSALTAAPVTAFYGSTPEKNYTRSFTNSGFTVKNIMKEVMTQMTLEFWIRPSNSVNWNQQIGPGWGNFLFHTDASNALYAGWDTSNRIVTKANTLPLTKWTHVAIVVDGGLMTAYVNGEKAGEISSGKNGIGGFGDLTFGAANNNGLNGHMDEVRIWNTARTQRQIQNMMHCEVADPANTPNLLLELQMDELTTQPPKDATDKHTVVNLGGTKSRGTYTIPFTDKRELKADFSLPEGPYYVGNTITATNLSSGNAVRNVWGHSELEGEALEVESPTIIFGTPGQKTITLTAYDPAGNTNVKEAVINVQAQPAPEVSFIASAEKVPVGHRISFINTSPVVAGNTYEWHMPGANIEKATTVNAAAEYALPGEHTVTLRITNAGGSNTFSKTIKVTDYEPIADFSLSPAVLIKGNKVQLTDNSQHRPDQWFWTISDATHHMVYNTTNPEVVMEDPGVYNVELAVVNTMGSNKTIRQRAIVVSNVDPQTGLSFSGDKNVNVTFNTPINPIDNKAFTIDWWMNPRNVTTTSHHIGGSSINVVLTTGSDGVLALTLAGIKYNTHAGFVVPGEWHHYAVSMNATNIFFYKDGQLAYTFYTRKLPSAMPTSMKLGSSTAPMNAMIDELRMWNSCLTENEIRQYANAPITDVAKAVADHKLALYYDFNQNSGDVQDRSGNNNTGTRSGFGPEGDAWTSSLGVFCLSNSTREDVSAKYLTNYKAPFLHTETTVNKGFPQFVELLQDDPQSLWILENATVTGGITTGFCVDTEQEDMMVIATKGYDFASEVSNHKLYQTITLPAGHYVFGAERVETYSDLEAHVVAAKGKGLPVADYLHEEAMDYVPLNDGIVSFSLYKEQEVSLGLLLNMKGDMVQHIKRFFLEKKITNDDFTWTGIDNAQTDAALTITPQAGGVSITAAAPTLLRIYNVAGMSIHQGTVNGKLYLNLPAGLYIANGQKFIVK